MYTAKANNHYNFYATEQPDGVCDLSIRLLNTFALENIGRERTMTRSVLGYYYYYYCWFLYSAILRCRADSLRSHVILHE